MLRKVSETFSATHLTAIILAGIIAPSAVFAVASFTNVAITDAKSGFTAYVDPTRHLNTYDPLLGYTNNPANLVNFNFYNTDNTYNNTDYTVPAGKVLLIKSITWNYFSNTEGNTVFLYLYDSNGNNIFNFEGDHVADFATANLGAPAIVRAGAITSSYGDNDNGNSASYAYVEGYLIPASAVPAPESPEAKEQFRMSSKMRPGGRQQ